ASKQPVGVPALPLFNKAQYNLANTWIKPYINVPQAQLKPFTSRIFGQRLIPEPAASTQSTYHSLDSVVQSVLTDRNANISQLLRQANSVAQDLIRRGS
ncbi:MAG: multiple sugar transport system substrate-binding protein, partial [Gaiellaceae bacterium]|nr:multiple sugar transport system substrate-binding protein [Gaiellaceae bacterium]